MDRATEDPPLGSGRLLPLGAGEGDIGEWWGSASVLSATSTLPLTLSLSPSMPLPWNGSRTPPSKSLSEVPLS